MKGVWVRPSDVPSRRFGDEWLALDLTKQRVLVVRGAPAIAAVELLERPRDAGALIVRVEEAAGRRAANEIEELLEEMREGRLLVQGNGAVPIDRWITFAAEPISFFTSAIETLFGGFSGASCNPGKPGPGGGQGSCSC